MNQVYTTSPTGNVLNVTKRVCNDASLYSQTAKSQYYDNSKIKHSETKDHKRRKTLQNMIGKLLICVIPVTLLTACDVTDSKTSTSQHKFTYKPLFKSYRLLILHKTNVLLVDLMVRSEHIKVLKQLVVLILTSKECKCAQAV